MVCTYSSSSRAPHTNRVTSTWRNIVGSQLRLVAIYHLRKRGFKDSALKSDGDNWTTPSTEATLGARRRRVLTNNNNNNSFYLHSDFS